jgi:hypothetical protein
LLLREVEKRRKIVKRFAACFTDHRNPQRIEHGIEELISQRVYALALGYEDLNDHDRLRNDVLLATLAGKEDPSGGDRKQERDKGKALAGKSTLNRLEFIPEIGADTNRYKKISLDQDKVEEFLIEVFLDGYQEPQKEIVLDLDETDDPVHGNQEGRFFHGYYSCYCYLPLYIFCGDHLLYAKLRPSNIDASEGSVEAIEMIVDRIRQVWPDVRIIVRGDSGFCREGLMSFCERNGIDYILGIAKNARLERMIASQMEHARRKYLRTGKAARSFRNFRYRTLNTWSRKRRVVGKAEYLAKGANPRFVVTSLSREEYPTRSLYEDLYCTRGEMENRIKEQQADLFADRTSTSSLRSNQLRLWFSCVAYTMMSELRRLALQGTDPARAYCGTIRGKLFKIGALITMTVRKIWVKFAEGYPYVALFKKALINLQATSPPG